MSDDDSSSSEDLPLSALRGKKEESSEEEEFEDEDSDDDEDDELEAGGEEEPDSDDFIVEESEEDDDADGDYASDTSDDAPLNSLKSKKTPLKKVKAQPAKKSAKKATPKKKAASAKKKKSTSAKKSSKAKQAASSSTSTYLCPSGELYAQCNKGKLIQSLLARWWYAYQWPDPKSLPESTPKGYDALDGFPGVYICTQGGDVGKFLDYRDHTQSPSFNNFAKKSSEELQGMLLRAIQEQMEMLIEHEGKDTDTEKKLKVLDKWVTKLNCSKADKDAAKVLKAKRLVLS